MKKIQPETIQMTVKSRLKELKRVEKLAMEIASRIGLTRDQTDNLSIAITETVGNAIVHGNKKDPDKDVDIAVIIQPDTIRVQVQDRGEGFDPDSLSDPLDPENLLKESGRGIFILKSLMDNVSFSFSPKGTLVEFEMSLRRSSDSENGTVKKPER
ncbi:MAG TPA: ATP-binding protein [bacterium]|nr:ATP-binding protein [bacterium]